MKEEIWKDIKGYEEFYQISNFGNMNNQEAINSTKLKLRILENQLR